MSRIVIARFGLSLAAAVLCAGDALAAPPVDLTDVTAAVVEWLWETVTTGTFILGTLFGVAACEGGRRLSKVLAETFKSMQAFSAIVLRFRLVAVAAAAALYYVGQGYIYS